MTGVQTCALPICSAIVDSGAKRVALYILRNIDAEQFLTSVNEGLEDNHTPDELAKIEPQRSQLAAIFRAVKSARNGDVILLDYAPGPGTRVTVNGVSKGTIPGEDFFRALLRIWLGDDPADSSLKKAMLGG